MGCSFNKLSNEFRTKHLLSWVTLNCYLHMLHIFISCYLPPHHTISHRSITRVKMLSVIYLHLHEAFIFSKCFQNKLSLFNSTNAIFATKSVKLNYQHTLVVPTHDNNPMKQLKIKTTSLSMKTWYLVC